MKELNNSNYIDVNADSPALQTHLSIMQGVIQRMASNSASSKTWCITIVSAILVAVVDKKNNADYVLIALLPAIIFCLLDSYYLALEKGFRNSYNDFIHKFYSKSLTIRDFYSVNIVGNFGKLLYESFISFSIWGFYIPLMFLIAITREIILKYK